MCGIIGVFSQDGVSVHEIERATKLMSHRGPDDEGYILYNGKIVEEFAGDDSVVRGLPHIKAAKKRKRLVFSMAHRRLSILDITEKGHQPMSDEERKVWIVHNGEIYNFREIKDELVKRGYTFRSGTDTEVILKAYKEWGTDCVRRFNGMWAFAILDTEKNTLFLSRDRLGVKPLYYYYYADDRFFAFASEIKPLLLLKRIPIEPNHEIIWDYLVRSLINHTDETFFRGIRQLPPSHNLIIEMRMRNQGKINFRLERYYELRVSDDVRVGEEDIDEIAGDLREILYSAVERHLVSDVPVGSCLSGGIDSSTIVCVINDILRKKEIPQVGDVQKTFTFSSIRKELDESDYAREVVRRCKVSSHFTSPDSTEFIKDIEKVVFHQEEPFGSTSIYGQYKLMEIARDAGVKVLLDGQGADELFAGYKTYFPVFITQLILSGEFGDMLRNVLGKFSLMRSDLMYSIPFVGLFLAITFERGIRKSILRFQHREQEKLILSRIIYLQRKLSTGKFIKAIDDDFFSQYTERFFEGFSNFFRWVGNLNRFLADSVLKFSLPELLRYEDRNSMAFSIESRPLFSDDVEVIDFAFSVPADAKIRDGWTKYILRRSMEGILPEKVLWRKDKFAFFTPEHEWVGKNKDFFKAYLLDVKDGYVNGEFIWQNFDEVLNFSGGIFKRGSFMWRLLNFKIWWKIFMEDIRKSR